MGKRWIEAVIEPRSRRGLGLCRGGLCFGRSVVLAAPLSGICETPYTVEGPTKSARAAMAECSKTGQQMSHDQTMEKEEAKSNWDDLARELGADVPSEPEPPERPHSPPGGENEPSEVASGPAKSSAKRPPPPRKPAGWDELADSFGLQRPAEEPPEPKKRPAKEPPEPKRRSAEEPPEPKREVMEQPPAPEPRSLASEPSAPASEAAPAEPPAPKAERSVSTWHRIFGSPRQQTERMTGAPDDEAATGQSIVFDEEDLDDSARGTGATTHREELSDEATSTGEVELEPSDADESSEERSADEEGQRPKRRPRRRRRGRGGRRTEDSSERDTKRSPAASKADAAEQERETREAANRIELGDVEFDDDDESEDAFDDEDLAGATSETGGRKDKSRPVPPSHRNLPSWEEAISVIVEANQQTRSERQRSPRSSTRSGSNRGRPRGGRRKKKS